MPICRPSAARRRAVLAVALADVAGIAGLAAAQISPGIDDNPSAREKVEREGEAAMDRLKGAVSRRKAQQQNGPSDLPKPSEVERRRAFEAMRDRAKSPAMEARARDALAQLDQRTQPALQSVRDALASARNELGGQKLAREDLADLMAEVSLRLRGTQDASKGG